MGNYQYTYIISNHCFLLNCYRCYCKQCFSQVPSGHHLLPLFDRCTKISVDNCDILALGCQLLFVPTETMLHYLIHELNSLALNDSNICVTNSCILYPTILNDIYGVFLKYLYFMSDGSTIIMAGSYCFS